MQLRVFIAGLLALTGYISADCSAIIANTDYVGNDLVEVNVNSVSDCCPACEANPLCSTFAYLNGWCYLKFGNPQRIEKYGVSTGAVVVSNSKCSTTEENVDYLGNDISRDPSITTPGPCCSLCTANPSCKLYVVSIFGCTLKSKAGARQPDLSPSWNVRAAFVSSTPTCGTVESNVDYPENDLQRYPSVTDSGQCCTLCNQNPACVRYVSSIFGCSLKSASSTKVSNLDPSWNARSAARGGFTTSPITLVDTTYTPNVRVTPLAITYAAGYQWFPNAQVESLQDDFAALVIAINATVANGKHGEKPEVIISPSPDGSSVYPFTSAQSIGECAALIKSHGLSYFTFVQGDGTCMGHKFTSTDKSYLLKSNGNSASVHSTVADAFLLKSTTATSDNDCIAQCKQTGGCVAARYTDKCYLYKPATARSQNVIAGWVTNDFTATPVANLPSFS